MMLDLLDLDLPKAFAALLEERCVTAAAVRLACIRRAVSNALLRLRDQLQDPLFVRRTQATGPRSRLRACMPS